MNCAWDGRWSWRAQGERCGSELWGRRCTPAVLQVHVRRGRCAWQTPTKQRGHADGASPPSIALCAGHRLQPMRPRYLKSRISSASIHRTFCIAWIAGHRVLRSRTAFICIQRVFTQRPCCRA